jgi:hypothetical protein
MDRVTFAEMLLEMVEGRPGRRPWGLVAGAAIAAAVAGASLLARGRR